ncbi:GMP synthase (glutamine-hydrolysing) [Palleronia marisminoris]|uniref:GMP synthase [glutamine-hydrolyzing] n=1 Tax=Palleronia marisminoris TaxID=315423 RepID=A0A1Y5RTI3_9RHOB|nr:type 1 glutamine amidotransferase [Palleronia marisminoris]SFG48923.1 GMP synthase (glutamine-hydrolysing) [Palleronia marisminoris]SLN25140.1 GMP synthase [glutamine-hydrolyzing] [Palleronia marisminoris]
MRIGLLQCGAILEPLAKQHGDYPQLYAQLVGPGFDWSVFRVFEGDVPDDPELCDGWLVSGSRHGAYEGHDWIEPLEALIRDIHGRRPLVGICFGHQVVAQALGGQVEKFAGGWSVGRRAYDWQGEIVHLNAWHQDQVIRPPEGFETIMTNDFTTHAGLSCGKTLTIQPHPEFDAGFIAGLMDQVGRGTVPEPLLAEAEATLPQPTDNAMTGARLATFFRDNAR